MAKKKAETPKTVEPTFEEALKELETIVRRLEQGGGPLESALDDYSQAIGLLKTCHQRLEKAERRVEMLSGVDAQGNPVTEPIQDQETSLEEKQQTRSQRRSASSDKRSLPKSEDLGLF
jgi:exodeoxyribonuclease VII small subunit